MKKVTVKEEKEKKNRVWKIIRKRTPDRRVLERCLEGEKVGKEEERVTERGTVICGRGNGEGKEEKSLM